ncbi:MAG TPA: potassium-transporting ATPase subunit KdpC [Gemmatimonadales bacterium]|nr:potassium-transporting ATPase subunit KdpC [Gemmatimonadales bacterium]
MIKNQIRPAIVVTLVLMVITGLAYPAAVTGLAQLLFPRQANGSLVTVHGEVVGSALIGQQFAGAGYFHSRPSGAGNGYDDTVSSGRNLGPTSAKLDTLVMTALDSERKLDAPPSGQVPADLATASGSGLDPHISPAAAAIQVARVARVRQLDSATVAKLVSRFTEGRQLGFLGEPRVNVLLLNLALDSVTNHR